MKPHVLISETTCAEHLRKIGRLGWGRMFCQRTIRPFPGERWGFDNGAFLDWQAGVDFDEFRFLDKLAQANAAGRPYMAVVPDIVGLGEESLQRSLSWIERLDPTWPWYLAVQDGMTLTGVREVLHLFAGVFLGGTDKFKLGAFKWCELAHSEGKPFHYARAGTLTKLRHAVRIGADSIDSAFPLWTHDRFNRFSAQWSYEDQQNELAFITLERRQDVRMRPSGACNRRGDWISERRGLQAHHLLGVRGLHRSDDYMVTT